MKGGGAITVGVSFTLQFEESPLLPFPGEEAQRRDQPRPLMNPSGVAFRGAIRG